MGRVTERSHQFLLPALGLAGARVDATCGNGHDTLFLATNSPAGSRIIALDIQRAALVATEQRLAAEGHLGETHSLDHRDLPRILPTLVPEEIAAAIANLGYLPGGDHRVITRAETSLPAAEAIAEALIPGGRLAIVAYPDHPGGEEEAAALRAWATDLKSPFSSVIDPPPPRGPFLITIERHPAPG